MVEYIVSRYGNMMVVGENMNLEENKNEISTLKKEIKELVYKKRILERNLHKC